MPSTLKDMGRCLVDVIISREYAQGQDRSTAVLRAEVLVRTETDERISKHSTPNRMLAEFASEAERHRLSSNGAKPLVSISAPSENSARPIDRIEVTMIRSASNNDKDLFFVQTNVPHSRGVAWRTLINALRTRYVNTTVLSRPDDFVPEPLNPYFIRQWLAQGTRSHTSTLVDEPAIPSFLHQSPSLRALSQFLMQTHIPSRVSISLSAPSDYSHLDFDDLTLTLGQEFITQFGRSQDPSDLDLGCMLQWLAVNVSSAAPLVRDSKRSTFDFAPILECTETLGEWFRLTRISNALFEGLNLLSSSMDLAISLNCPDLIHDRLMNTYASMLMAGLCPVYNSDSRFETALTRLETHIALRPSRHTLVLNNFGYLFRECSEKLGRSDKLNISITMLQKALDLLPAEDGSRVDVLRNIMYGLYARYRATRDFADLELALQCFREATTLEAKGIGCIPRWSLLLDFAKLVQEADLEGMIDALRESHQLCPSDHPLRYSVLAHLADALFRRYNQNQADCVDDLHVAGVFAKGALDLAPAGHPTARGYFLVRLASILSQKTLIAETPCQDDLDEVIRMAEESLSSFGKHHKRYLALQLLGVVHTRRYLRLSGAEDAISAHTYLTEALAVTDAGIASTHRAEYLASLAEIHLFPNTPLHDVMQACRYSEMCLNDPHTDVVNRLVYLGAVFNRIDENSPPSCPEVRSALVNMLLRAVDLLPEIAYLSMDVKASLQALRGWESLAISTSLLCSRAQRYQDAVCAIEKGRAIFWSQALKVRSKATDKVSTELRQQLSQLGAQIEQRRYLPKRQSSMPARDWAQDRHLGEQYEFLVKQIRELPGNEAFAALSPEELMHISNKGPVVMLTAHENLCIAYIFTKDGADDGSGLIVCELEQVNSQKLGQYVSRMTNSNVEARDILTRDMGFESPVDCTVSSPLNSAFGDSAYSNMERALRRSKQRKRPTLKDDVLQPLFYEIVKPVFIALGLKPSTGRDRPRLWWCPTGPFTSLPIHAAGDYYLYGECCSDYVVSSYTPTCTALLTARKTFKPVRTSEAKVLLAAVPRPFRGRPLEGTVTELEQICAVVPKEQRIDIPESDDPLLGRTLGMTSETILQKLPEASVLHLASHGTQDSSNPLNSGFILRDKKLTISQLMPLPLPNAFLAFLSACETAKGDKEQADQVIHLASTMLFAGFKSVVGTMWTMSDTDGPSVATHLYEQLFSEDREYLDPYLVPYALDEAVQRLRERDVSSTRWATFIHLGM